PFPAPVETVAELRTRLALAEERLTELKAMLEDMRRDRDAWREQAQTRLLPAPAAAMSWWRWLRATGCARPGFTRTRAVFPSASERGSRARSSRETGRLFGCDPTGEL